MLIEDQVKALKGGTAEYLIGSYLLDKMKNDPEMVTRYESNNRTVGECMAYITKVAEKRAVCNRAVISDKEVYDLAVHYALDGIPEGIKIGKVKAKVATSKDSDKDDDSEEESAPEPVPKKKAAKPKKFESDQLTLF